MNQNRALVVALMILAVPACGTRPTASETTSPAPRIIESTVVAI